MTLNYVKLERAVTFMKYLASIVRLVSLAETLVWNKFTFLTSNLLNFAELVENESSVFWTDFQQTFKLQAKKEFSFPCIPIFENL